MRHPFSTPKHDPLADPPPALTIEGIPLVATRLPAWFTWAALGAAFILVGGLGLALSWSVNQDRKSVV